jgi:nicotinate-nucleotide--dimethylbenzimidazole phosphoribosyltransferase
MTDTGQIPGEGLPENAGADAGADALLPPHTAFPGNGAPQQPGWGTEPVGEQPGYAYLDHPAPPGTGLDDEDDVLLMPGPQGSWSDPQPVPPQPEQPSSPLDQQSAAPLNQQPPQAPSAAAGAVGGPLSPQQPAGGAPVSLRQSAVDRPISVEVPVEVPLETVAPPVLGSGAQVFVAQHAPAPAPASGQDAGSAAGSGHGGPAAGAAGAQQAAAQAGEAGSAAGHAGGPAGTPGPPQAEVAPSADSDAGQPIHGGATPAAGLPEQQGGAPADSAGSEAAEPGQPAPAAWPAPADAAPAPQAAVPRRPLHLGPPVPDTPSGGVSVRSLADRGPAVSVPGPPTSGPEYLDVPRDDTGAIPAQQIGEPGQAAVVTPGSPWPAAPGGASQQSLIPRADSVPRPAEPVQPAEDFPAAPVTADAPQDTPAAEAPGSDAPAEGPVTARPAPVPADAPADVSPAEAPAGGAVPSAPVAAEQAAPVTAQAAAAPVAADALQDAPATEEPAVPAESAVDVVDVVDASVAAEVDASPSVAPGQAAPAEFVAGPQTVGSAAPEPGTPEQQAAGPVNTPPAAGTPLPGQRQAAPASAEVQREAEPQAEREAEPQPEAPEPAVDAGGEAPAEVAPPAGAPDAPVSESRPEAVAATEAAGSAPAPGPAHAAATAAEPAVAVTNTAAHAAGAAAEEPGAASSAPGRGRRGRRRAAPAVEEPARASEAEQVEPAAAVGTEALATTEAPAVEPAPAAAGTETPPAVASPAGTDASAPVAQSEPAAEPEPEPAAVSEARPSGEQPAPQDEPDGPAAEDTTPEDPAREDAAETAATADEDAAPPAEPVVQGPAAEPYEPSVRDAVHRVIRERRDIRNGFRPDPIPHDVLLRVLEAAHTAPSVGHSQPWDFVVIRSEKTREKMHELAMSQRDAYAESLPKARARQFRELKIEAILDTPVNIVVTADPTRGGRHTLGRHTQPQMAPYSSALAVENLWLAARAEGLGVGWVSFFDERQMVAELGLPEHLEVVAYLCVGYVDEFPEEPELMQAGWSQRRPLSWVVHDEEYGNRALPGEEPHDLLEETLRGIRPLDAKALGEAWERQKRMTKPAGALGMLEIISAQLSGLSRQCPPPIPEPAAVAVFAGDHGVHAQGVTAWPQEVTGQMVANILGGGAVCNAFANQVGAEVCVVDVGVASELPPTPGLLPRKVRPGTADFTAGPAMTREEVLRAIEVGIETARDLISAGNRALLTGEMGIANTTASAAVVAVYTGADPAEVTGRGTGINDEMHARKVEVVRRALDLHRPDPGDPIAVLAAVGGLEHAAMVGLLLGAAALRTPVILDGVSAGAAALVARAIAPEVLAACIAGHRSAEPGHVAALTTLGLRPLVDLDLRLGEGTGALLALPLVQSAARVMHEVATFDSAGVTEKG